jgi:PAS domain S-box-containing protein
MKESKTIKSSNQFEKGKTLFFFKTLNIAREVIGKRSLEIMSSRSEGKHHEDLVSGLYDQMKAIFESSEQAMFLYLDDNHKACNKKFSSLLGYNSPQEWAGIEKSFLDTFVAEKNQKSLQTTYLNAMEKMIGSTIEVTWKKKSGGTVDTLVILVPMAYSGHLFALHFVSPKV